MSPPIFFARFYCFFGSVHGKAFGHWQTIISKQLFALILVKVHRFMPLVACDSNDDQSP